MTIKTLSSAEFQQNTLQAQEAAQEGPVFITRQGEPSYVLLSIAEYRRITTPTQDIIDLLGMPPGVEDIEIEFPRSREHPREIDLS